jgi:DNA-binding SARP family transcriptional activator
VLPGRRQASLFTMLAYHAGTVIHPRALLDELWGANLPVNPTNALQSQVSRLRRVLGESTVVLRDAGYALEVDPLRVDTVRFEALVARGHHLLTASEPSAARECFVRGLDFWRGEPLARLTQLGFVARECRRLEDLRVHAVVGRARADLALGHGQDAVSELRRLVDLHPTREDLWAHLALTLYRCGRQAEALATLRSARIVLADELGLDPGPALRALEAAILRQDIPSH